MDSDQRSVTLTSAQVRGVSATLRVVEEAVERIERLLAGPASGLTFRLHDDLDAEERQAIGRACSRIRAALVTVSRSLGAECSEHSLRAEIRGECAVVWAAVQETGGQALRGYGPLSSEAGVVVEAALEEIAGPLVDILRRLSGPRSREKAVSAVFSPGDEENRT